MFVSTIKWCALLGLLLLPEGDAYPGSYGMLGRVDRDTGQWLRRSRRGTEPTWADFLSCEIIYSTEHCSQTIKHETWPIAASCGIARRLETFDCNTVEDGLETTTCKKKLYSLCPGESDLGFTKCEDVTSFDDYVDPPEVTTSCSHLKGKGWYLEVWKPKPGISGGDLICRARCCCMPRPAGVGDGSPSQCPEHFIPLNDDRRDLVCPDYTAWTPPGQTP